MDPYLEAPALWPAFQHHLIACLCDTLQPALGDRYRLRPGTRAYIHELVLFTSVRKEEHQEEFLEIRHRPTGKVITLVDIVGPANRTTTTGRREYLAKRDQARRTKTHLVEIDLVLQGQSCLDISAETLPAWDYAVSVCRAHQPDRYEVYTTTLQKRLPRFRLPLSADERDAVVDLQAIFERVYDQNFAARIDYKKDSPVLLRDDDQRWARILLNGRKPPTGQ